ncbi:Mur ligase domain-containing protein [Nocardia sp. NPDC052112]|uniref:Mur ligase domain-containing protein n=1 Tax=Nocardia sp. NPDC052112 TaxID=3155646 RepID=UPI00343ECF02
MTTETVHLIGCLGQGMMPLARLYVALGVQVSGCDRRATTDLGYVEADVLRRDGVSVDVHDERHISRNVSLVVHSVAIGDDHSELMEARRRGIPVISRPVALARLVSAIADRMVAVSGVTGKTTTTGLTSQLLRQLGSDTLTYIGSPLQGMRSDIVGPYADIAVVEACEYNFGMLELEPDVAAVMSMYWGEHSSCYLDLDSVHEAFFRFLARAPVGVVPAGEVELAAKVRRANRATEILTFGSDSTADVQLTSARIGPEGTIAEYRVLGTEIRAHLSFAGLHNMDNLGAAMACITGSGSSVDALRDIDFSRLRLPRRRFEFVGKRSGTDYFDDFAHNPMQIDATSSMLRQLYTGKLGAFYLPSGFGRLHAFGDQYVDALGHFDRVVLAPSCRVFEDAPNVPDESRFAEITVAKLCARGVDAEVVGVDEVTLDMFEGCAAACFCGALRLAGVLRSLFRIDDRSST